MHDAFYGSDLPDRKLYDTVLVPSKGFLHGQKDQDLTISCTVQVRKLSYISFPLSKVMYDTTESDDEDDIVVGYNYSSKDVHFLFPKSC